MGAEPDPGEARSQGLPAKGSALSLGSELVRHGVRLDEAGCLHA